jgi:hypothetical protein
VSLLPFCNDPVKRSMVSYIDQRIASPGPHTLYAPPQGRVARRASAALSVNGEGLLMGAQ